MKNCIIASTSTVYKSGYLEYLLPELEVFFKHARSILFIPYAQPGGISCDAYSEKAALAFDKIGIQLVGLHTLENPEAALRQADGIFTGGGNTFRLVNKLYKTNVMSALRKAVLSGIPYLGTSAGSNICGLTMQTTNDMPIVYPPSFATLGIVPFNINPHYLDPDPDSTHMGETRETRIKEFHSINTIPVVGLREGSWLAVKGNTVTLKGDLPARVFEWQKPAYEVEAGVDLSSLS